MRDEFVTKESLQFRQPPIIRIVSFEDIARHATNPLPPALQHENILSLGILVPWMKVFRHLASAPVTSDCNDCLFGGYESCIGVRRFEEPCHALGENIMRQWKSIFSIVLAASLCPAFLAVAAERQETKTIVKAGVFVAPTKYPTSYLVRDWSIQMQFKTATSADVFWIVFSPIEGQTAGQAWGYRSPEELQAVVKMLQDARANGKPVLYYYLDPGHDFLLVNMTEPAFIDP